MRSLAIFAATLALAACSRGDTGRVGHDEVLVEVRASGRAEVRPDEARMTVGVDTIAPTSGAANAQNAAAANRIVAALQTLGVKPDDVQTRSLTLSRIDYGPRRGSFSASNVVDVRVREVSRAGEAVAAATAAGGNVVAGPNLRVGNPDAADNAAHAAAFLAARGRAEAYAKAAGLRVDRVLGIRDAASQGQPIDYGQPAPEERAATVSPMSMPPPPVRAGVDVREVSVRVDFVLSK